MSKFEKGIFDLLLRENEVEFFKDDEIERLLNENDDWLITQFSRFLKNKLTDFSCLKDKINFLNQLIENNKWTNLKAIKKDFADNLKNASSNFLIKKDLWAYLIEEFKTAQEVEIISPFISNSIVNILRNILENYNNIKSLKIITTTFDGQSKYLDLKSLQELKNNYSNIVNIKIENLFEKSNKRLHIKSYFFKRNNNFSSLYLGSSNFTKTGLITGKEFNLKISEFKDKTIIDEYKNEFDKLYNSNFFVDINDDYQINQIIMRQIFEDEEFNLNQQKQLERITKQNTLITPYDYQISIIENVLQRIKDNKNKHLLVMATGTGKTKTMMFIYEQLSLILKKEFPSLLYICPRKEILDQTLKDYRNYFETYDFGVEYYDSRNKNINLNEEKIIFTNIETLSKNKNELKNINFDIVVFDEAHHVSANTFNEIYNIVSPNSKQIFGLTATPERTDNINVNIYFNNEYAANLRLYEAIEKELLCDFDYYFIKDDSTNLTGINIIKDEKKLDEKLNFEERHEFVYKIIKKYIGVNSKNAKAILFCNSVNHANDLCNFLKNKNEKCATLLSNLNSKDRQKILDNFQLGKINFLCVRDIFNEGIDVPEIDSIFFLRPTSSTLIYLQQLGRGLRKVLDKKLQIYDFVNNVDFDKNKNYNPLMAVNLLTKNLKINSLINNINNIDNIKKFLPGESNFIFSKYDKEFFIENLKKYENKNLYTIILDEYRTGLYEDYKSFFIDKNLSIYFYYEKKFSFFKENFKKNSCLKHFLILNNKNLILEIINVLENKIQSKNKLVNNIILTSFYYSPKETDIYYYDLKLAFNLIFEKENEILIKEIIYLLKFKLENENLINNEITNNILSFVNCHLTHNQFLSLCSINIKCNQFYGKGNMGIISNPDEKILAIDASTTTQDTKFKHINYFDFQEKIFYWDSPNNWDFDYNENKDCLQKKLNDLQNYKIYIFYKDQNLIKEKGNNVRLFIGQVKNIISREKITNPDLKKSEFKVRYVFKLY